MQYDPDEITELLQEWSDGDPEALDKLMPVVFDDVREIARKYFERESSRHTLQPTALVNEVYLRLEGLRTVQWQNRFHFFGAMAGMLRRLLVDHARRQKSAKRGGGEHELALDEALIPTQMLPRDLVELDDALDALKGIDPRRHQVVELKFFMGLTRDEIADVLSVSRTTVIRDWANARAWLLHELSKEKK